MIVKTGEQTMEETGMTDLQFKSFLRTFIRSIEEVRAQTDKERTDEKLDALIHDLRISLQG